MSSDSTRTRRARKPSKPHKDFPLFPHASGRWCKKILGKFKYFGQIKDDPLGERALALWIEQKDELLAGRTPSPKSDKLTVADLANHFLTAKESLRKSGELSHATFSDYHKICGEAVAQLGKSCPVAEVRPPDLERLRAVLARSGGVNRLVAKVTVVRSMFRYGWEAGLYDAPLRFGSFKVPSKSTLRKARAAAGPRMFEAAEVCRLLSEASQPLKTMILLAVNAGLGNNDCACLRFEHLDLGRGWMDYPRPKSGIARRARLWPETVAAIREAIATRPSPQDGAHAERVFITKYGGLWVSQTSSDNPVAKEFLKLTKATGLNKMGRGFYSLRHVFETIGGGSRDQVAVDRIMGHADNSMADRYRERIDDERLERVAEHVRKWVFKKDEDQAELLT